MNKHSNILIAGAGEAGRMLLREYAKRRKAHLVAGLSMMIRQSAVSRSRGSALSARFRILPM
jgi:FlaA1/EpsC-like NDP-sugar epimerase